MKETTWYFEMRSPEQFRTAKIAPDIEVRRVSEPTPEFLKFLWFGVGTPWNWASRAQWSNSEWQQLMDDTAIHVWVGYKEGTPVGYFELRQTPDRDVEILFFGLLPKFIGKGYGGHLLNEAITRAWEMGTNRVWVHTCNFDGPHAVANYKARGFELYDEKTEDVPDAQVQPSRTGPIGDHLRHVWINPPKTSWHSTTYRSN